MLITLMAFRQMSILLVAFVYKHVRYNTHCTNTTHPPTHTHTWLQPYYFDITHSVHYIIRTRIGDGVQG